MSQAVATEQRAYWRLGPEEALAALGSSRRGLSTDEAVRRLERFGPNQLEPPRRAGALGLLLRQFASPIVLLLIFATVISLVLGDVTDAAIILAIVLGSALLGFFQERGASRAVQALLQMVQVEAEVRRDGGVRSIPLREIVPGDVVLLNAGDLVPGDCLVLSSRDVLVDEAALTGESYPSEKLPGALEGDPPLAGRTNSLYLATHVASGQGEALVVGTGRSTEFGAVSAGLRRKPPKSGFQHGVTGFGLLLVRVTVALTAAILGINLLLHRPVIDSLLFSLALAVGLTPQLLPAIVSVSLARGARRMARERVIVRRLESIEDFGSMDVLCTDKTGTLTHGAVVLSAALGVDGTDNPRVLRLARLNARLQTGFTNPIDDPCVAGTGGDRTADGTERLDEIPYDFARKRLSVLVSLDGTSLLITKGALESVLAVCSEVQTPDGSVRPLAAESGPIRELFHSLSGDGYRVLGVACRDLQGRRAADVADEAGMTFLGFLTFLDPPKEGIAAVLEELSALGVSLRLVTGDNRLVAAHVAKVAGLDGDRLLTGSDLDRLTDEELAGRVGEASVFAEVEPAHKERIVGALRRAGHVTGFLGDGINDAPALHAADVGISVNTATDVAKQSAAIVLLDKDLAVVADGVRLGRQTFANTLKYIFVTTSANVGNMISMAGAAAFLPFLPLLPRQILLLNFLTDLPGTTIATDAVDAEQLDRPQRWNVRLIRDFMLVFGLISSCFDVLTFVTMRVAFGAGPALFRSGWFVESVATELAVMLVLRTRRLAIRSRPSLPLLASSLAIGAITVALPFSPLAEPLGLVGPPLRVLLVLAVITAGYVAATEAAKALFWRRRP